MHYGLKKLTGPRSSAKLLSRNLFRTLLIQNLVPRVLPSTNPVSARVGGEGREVGVQSLIFVTQIGMLNLILRVRFLSLSGGFGLKMVIDCNDFD